MKILSLRFKNINSLVGENSIDFTAPIFTNNGLFAITGKTGSGKTSILDAISLALYGKTPRVDVTGSENAILTKGERECFAEIVFEVSGQKWKSSWKQQLNRNGNLNKVNRQIASGNDEIVADQPRSCDAKIIEILGLTFPQFTKVIMLAQGSFAAFLQADKNEKGQLLEQITGTEIYAEISKAVSERAKEEAKKLESINQEISYITVLTEDEIGKLKQEIELKETEKLVVDLELQNVEKALKWLQDLELLQQQLSDLQLNEPVKAEEAYQAKKRFDDLDNDLNTAKKELTDKLPIFNNVRKLDVRIEEKTKLLAPLKSEVSDLHQENNEISKKKDKQTSELEKMNIQLEENRRWAEQNSHFAELVSVYSVIEKESVELDEHLKDISKRESELSSAFAHLQEKKQELDELKTTILDKDNALGKKRDELEGLKKSLSDIIDGKDMVQLQHAKESLSDLVLLAKGLKDIEESIADSKREIAAQEVKSKESVLLKEEKEEIIGQCKKKIETQNREISLLEELIKLNITIQTLEAHRHQLKDGKECPLCGALEHPFATGNLPQKEDREDELKELKKELGSVNQELSDSEKSLSAINSTIEYSNQVLAKEIISLKKLSETKQQTISSIKEIDVHFSISDEDTAERLNHYVAYKTEELKSVRDLVGSATEWEKKIANIRDKDIPALSDEKVRYEDVFNKKSTEYQLENRDYTNQTDALKTIKNTFLIERESYSKKLEAFAVKDIIALKKCLNAWNDNSGKRQLLEVQSKDTANEIIVLDREIELKTKLLHGKQKQKEEIEAEQISLISERKSIFADKSVEAEERQLNDRINGIETSWKEAQQVKNGADTALETTKELILRKGNEYSKVAMKQITEKNKEDLQSEYGNIKDRSNNISQIIGAHRQRLNANQDNIRRSGTKLEEKEKQKQINDNWASLDKLIGSANGDKYRNYAQSLTFEYLIGLANAQLQKMSDRYILIRSTVNTAPFDLFVIDKFQDNQLRPSANLSGGEKFIISLSLALGLANMASKNMRIDTMFIDEGFGTLDSDYLDLALNALSNLQSDGKVIGVISHITELKERIATHIEVLPTGNGYSKIQIRA